MFGSQRYWRVALTLGASLLCSPTAWAVPVDSLRCTFDIRDGANNIVSTTEVSPQVARVPVPEARAPGFRETRSGFEISTRLDNRGEFGAHVSYYTATDGTEGFQVGGCSALTFCSMRPGGSCATEDCRARLCPADEPYCDWRPVALFDGVPQLDSSAVNLSERVWRDGEITYRTSLQCRHLGTYP